MVIMETKFGASPNSGAFIPSPHSDAVANELQEMSLQPAPNLLPVRERKDAEAPTEKIQRELINQGIMPPLKSSAAFHEQRRSLERARSSAEPSLQAKQMQLKRARLADDLNDKISTGRGPWSSSTKTSCLQFPKASGDNSSCDEDSSYSLSPEDPLSQESPLGLNPLPSAPETLSSIPSPAQTDRQPSSSSSSSSTTSSPPRPVAASTAANQSRQTSAPLTGTKPACLPPNLDEMKVAELKSELKLRSLTVSGTKNDLIERLRSYQELKGGADTSSSPTAGGPTGPGAGGAARAFRSAANTTTHHNNAAPLATHIKEEPMCSPPAPCQFSLKPASLRTHCPITAPAPAVDLDKDRLLHEKDRQIEDLTRLLRQNQRLVELLRLQLEHRSREGAEPLVLVRVKQEPPDKPSVPLSFRHTPSPLSREMVSQQPGSAPSFPLDLFKGDSTPTLRLQSTPAKLPSHNAVQQTNAENHCKQNVGFLKQQETKNGGPQESVVHQQDVSQCLSAPPSLQPFFKDQESSPSRKYSPPSQTKCRPPSNQHQTFLPTMFTHTPLGLPPPSTCCCPPPPPQLPLTTPQKKNNTSVALDMAAWRTSWKAPLGSLSWGGAWGSADSDR
ncbi:hypothetical protein F7725_003768 [Dissostichus mawsoni]|uniref:SAP domain-containing protein n=1 Tax=Dissostichus mawsoni TaxID=36200 RepID=A0A7J5YB85_DISMA|nr:hypothetical protein F7725_003768 [Dissostichus mawsoni]